MPPSLDSMTQIAYPPRTRRQAQGEPAMQRFKALVASKGQSGQTLAWQELGEADLMEGDVLVHVSHSTINYKDGLAITGKAPVIRRWPMIPGIDMAGPGLSSPH